ncbi:hypothetical protein CCH79_00019704 [Gambusia affinis]|uniref:Uncharacterized protein n=1 Tax=Gambusia affinis TaxID=33528 RepID=A0A315VY45_GAMAF|nr:hypothetical protein CCH79_00019704 [Gambusia affinis]
MRMKVCQQLLSRAFSHRGAACACRTGSVTPDTGRWRCVPSVSLCSSSAQDRKSRPSMLKHLSAKIRSTGPITVSEYMREVLTNPVAVRLTARLGAGLNAPPHRGGA